MDANSNDPEERPIKEEKPLFRHPPWMLGLVLIFAVYSILAGLRDPIWLLLGLPFILVLALYIYVRIATRKREGK